MMPAFSVQGYRAQAAAFNEALQPCFPDHDTSDRYVIIGCGAIGSAVLLSQTASYAREGNYKMATKFAALAMIPIAAVIAQVSELIHSQKK